MDSMGLFLLGKIVETGEMTKSEKFPCFSTWIEITEFRCCKLKRGVCCPAYMDVPLEVLVKG